MKLRHGFVSNSSSSSFVCNVCGQSEAGYDGEYEYENNPFRCVNKHTVHQRCAPLFEGEDDSCYEIPVEICPICNFTVLDDGDALKYILKKIGRTNEDLLAEIKTVFAAEGYKSFKDTLKK